MKKSKSQIVALAMCGLFVASGAVVQSAVAMEQQPVGSPKAPNLGGLSDVSKHPSAKSGVQWSDNLKREHEEAKKSKEQAQKERDQAQKERDEAQQAHDTASKDGSIQAKSGSGSSGDEQQNEELNRMIKERDQYLKERDALQQETTKFRQERDRAMSAISGGSALDAVDSGMPVKQRH